MGSANLLRPPLVQLPDSRSHHLALRQERLRQTPLVLGDFVHDLLLPVETLGICVFQLELVFHHEIEKFRPLLHAGGRARIARAVALDVDSLVFMQRERILADTGNNGILPAGGATCEQCSKKKSRQRPECHRGTPKMVKWTGILDLLQLFKLTKTGLKIKKHGPSARVQEPWKNRR